MCEYIEQNDMQCLECGHDWEQDSDFEALECPNCGSNDIDWG